MKRRIVVLLTVFCLLLTGTGFAQSNRSAEVKLLLAGLDSPSSTRRIKVAKIVSRSGLTDPELYEKVAALLKAGYLAGTDSNHIDEMSWLCKALAASGDEQYRSLFKEIISKSQSVKLQRYARQSNALLEEYARRSQILNAKKNWDENLTPEENRLVAMLKSDNVGLKRDAAKMLVRRLQTDEKVFDVAAETLVKMAENAQSGSRYVDTMSWLCKSLAASGNAKFIETLEQIKAGTDNFKLQSYATKAIKAL